MRAHPILLQMKYSRIVELYAKRNNVSTLKALDIFYNSNLYTLVSEGISDMQCLSDGYLVEELEKEVSKNNS